MWVTNIGGDTVTELSPAGATLGTFAVGDGPGGIAFDGTNMWVANGYDASNTVTELSPTGATLGTFAVGTSPHGIAFDGTNMWVANAIAGDSTHVTELSPAGATLGTFAVGTAARRDRVRRRAHVGHQLRQQQRHRAVERRRASRSSPANG